MKLPADIPDRTTEFWWLGAAVTMTALALYVVATITISSTLLGLSVASGFAYSGMFLLKGLAARKQRQTMISSYRDFQSSLLKVKYD